MDNRKEKIDKFYAHSRSLGNTDYRAVGWPLAEDAEKVYSKAASFDKQYWEEIESVLDIGSGLGGFCAYLQSQNKFKGKYLGIEILEQYAKSSQEKFLPNQNIQFECRDFLKHDFGNVSFDWVFSLGSLSVLQENQKREDYLTIQKMNQLAKKGFTVYLNDADNLMENTKERLAKGLPLATHKLNDFIGQIIEIVSKYEEIKIEHVDTSQDYQKTLVHVFK